MDILLLLLPQITKMFLLMGVGYWVYRKEFLSEGTTKQISWLLVNLVIPSVLFNSFLREFRVQEFKQLGLAFVMSCVGMLLGGLYAKVAFKKEQVLERFAVIFSNAAFIGIPIIYSLFGQEAVFYLSAYIVVFTLSVWTYGVYLISEDSKEVQIAKIIKNPNIVAIVTGLVLYVLSISLPNFITETFQSIGSMNTPLSMMLLGTYLAKDSLAKLISNVKCYWVGLGRLLVVPLLTIGVLVFFPADIMLKMVVVVVNSVPSAVMLAVFAQMYEKDSAYGAQLVSFTTLVSLVTLPVIVLLAQWAFSL